MKNLGVINSPRGDYKTRRDQPGKTMAICPGRSQRSSLSFLFCRIKGLRDPEFPSTAASPGPHAPPRGGDKTTVDKVTHGSRSRWPTAVSDTGRRPGHVRRGGLGLPAARPLRRRELRGEHPRPRTGLGLSRALGAQRREGPRCRSHFAATASPVPWPLGSAFEVTPSPSAAGDGALESIRRVALRLPGTLHLAGRGLTQLKGTACLPRGRSPATTGPSDPGRKGGSPPGVCGRSSRLLSFVFCEWREWRADARAVSRFLLRRRLTHLGLASLKSARNHAVRGLPLSWRLLLLGRAPFSSLASLLSRITPHVLLIRVRTQPHSPSPSPRRRGPRDTSQTPTSSSRGHY